MAHRGYSRGRGSSRPREGWTDRSQSDTKKLRNEIKHIVHKLAEGRNDLAYYEMKYEHSQSAATAQHQFENVHYHRGELRRALLRFHQLIEEDPYVWIQDNYLHINSEPLRRCIYEQIPKLAQEKEITLNFFGLKYLWEKTEGVNVGYDEPHLRFPNDISVPSSMTLEPLPEHYGSVFL